MSKIVSTFAVDTVQSVRRGGIRWSLSIVNKGTTPIALSNPMEYTTIRLWNSQRRGIELPIVAPRKLIDVVGPDGPEKPPLVFPFKLAEVRLNGRRLTPAEIQRDQFQFPPRGVFRITGVVDRVLKGWDSLGDPNAPIPPPTPIEAGEYRLAATLYLSIYRDLNHSFSVDSQPVAIRLTR